MNNIDEFIRTKKSKIQSKIFFKNNKTGFIFAAAKRFIADCNKFFLLVH